MSPPIQPRSTEPTIGQVMEALSRQDSVLAGQTLTLNKLDATMHGVLPDGSDGMKARMLKQEGITQDHMNRFAQSDKLKRKAVWGTLATVGTLVLTAFVTNFHKFAALFSDTPTPPPAH